MTITLKQARKQSGLKTGYICKFMGFSTAFLYGLENGLYPVSQENRVRFSTIYGCKVTDIQYAKTN